MPYYELKKKLAEDIARFIGHPEVTVEGLRAEFSAAPSLTLGHIAVPCFSLAKVLEKPTDQIAVAIAAHFTGSALTAKAAGPYANFKWDLGLLYEDTLERLLNQGDRYGSDGSGVGRRVVLEYCSPGIAKKLTSQHIRSTLIGNTLSNVYEFLGYSTERMNFIGDWGGQFARLLAAAELWGDRNLIAGAQIAPVMDHLQELYVRFHNEVDQNPTLMTRAQRCLQLLEDGENPTQTLWAQIREVSIKSMGETLQRLNTQFNYTEGESAYVPSIESTLSLVKEKAAAHMSEGAWIIDVETVPTPAVIQKRDGTTLYLTRDIAAAIDRFLRFKFDRMLYVVSDHQKLHFELLFGVLKKMGCLWAERCEHLSFGAVSFGDEKPSTREGRLLFLDDLLNEMHGRALVECTAKNPELMEKEAVAENVGIAALVFGHLCVPRAQEIELHWKQILAWDGETGPYVWDSLVRCRSLLAKAGEFAQGVIRAPIGYDYSSEEEALILQLAKFRSILHQVVCDNEPWFLTHYMVEVSKAFNRFCYRFPVLQSTDGESRVFRLNLARGTEQVLKNGLTLLGIRCPKEM